MSRYLKAIYKLFFYISLLILYIPIIPVNANVLTGGYVLLKDSRVSASTIYTIDFDNVTTSIIKCIKVGFSASATSQTTITGLDASSATFYASTDYIPSQYLWSVSHSSGVLSITYATGEIPTSSSDRTVVISGVTNGSIAETSYFILFSTYNNTDCTSNPVDSGVVAFIYENGQIVTVTIDPSLTFTISPVSTSTTIETGATTTVTTTDGTVPLGTLSTSANSIAAHDLDISTNAAGGYSVTVHYTADLTSGSNTIDDWTGTNAAPTTFSAAGTEAFGYTTTDYTLNTTVDRFSTNKWAAFDTTPAIIMYGTEAASESAYLGYQAGISTTTLAGVYQTTVIFIATPTY